MKKNSLLPLLALLLLLGTLPFCISRGAGGGSFGPQLSAGIYRGEEQPLIRDIDGLPISITVAEAPRLRGLMPADRRVGLEVLPWSETVIVAEDDHPVTRATVKGLAEVLSVDPEGGYRMVVIVMPDQDAVSVPGLRLLRVSTLVADLPDVPGGAASAELAFSAQDARGESGDDWRRQVGVRESGFHLLLRQETVSIEDVDWSRWYANIGRRLAERALRECRGSTPELAWDDPGFRDRHDDWGDAVPVPPRHEALGWQSAWQDPLLRGWTGIIHGRHYTDRRLAKQAIDEDLDRQLTRADWRRRTVLIDDVVAWSTDRRQGLETLRLRGFTWGFTVHATDVRDEPQAVFDGWLAAAEAGEALARRHLRQHLHCPPLAVERRARARELLAGDAGLAERVVLEPGGEEAGWLAWLRGIREERPAGDLPSLDREGWEGGHRLGLVGEVPAVLIVAQDGHRMQVWWRQAGGQAQRSDVVEGTAAVADHTLVVRDGAIGSR